MQNTIIVRLSDGLLHKFDADETSIYNLCTGINNLVNHGTEKIPYHETGKTCQYFSNSDMSLVVDAAFRFNAEKKYQELIKDNQ